MVIVGNYTFLPRFRFSDGLNYSHFNPALAYIFKMNDLKDTGFRSYILDESDLEVSIS